jgi:hypothetical protein
MKRIGTKETSSLLSGYNHDGSTVKHRISHTGDGIGGTRSTGYNTYTHLTRRACIALRSMGCTLFVAYEHLLEIILMVKHGIKHGHDTATGVTEHGIHPFVYERLHESF